MAEYLLRLPDQSTKNPNNNHQLNNSEACLHKIFTVVSFLKTKTSKSTENSPHPISDTDPAMHQTQKIDNK
ncbi:hypothetical protein [Synechococcus sp. WH 8020]|uniref:hypothetical protein n=1 Tax=Synechococcus sp. (strain WH8020) TaxID=32052 RepID=UPI001FE16D5C|nr:hypothetical protein [Synechococcus sp. WH 8020]